MIVCLVSLHGPKARLYTPQQGIASIAESDAPMAPRRHRHPLFSAQNFAEFFYITMSSTEQVDGVSG